MTKEEMLMLRKTLTDHLDKEWICISKSSAGASVLFVRKPGGSLRFCVNYRKLNEIIKKNRTPLPLIIEILRMMAKAE
jgi:ribosomal protein L24E